MFLDGIWNGKLLYKSIKKTDITFPLFQHPTFEILAFDAIFTFIYLQDKAKQIFGLWILFEFE